MLANNTFADTEAQKAQLKADDKLYLEYRKMIESELGQRFKFLMKDGPEARAARKVLYPKFFLSTSQPTAKYREANESVGVSSPSKR